MFFRNSVRRKSFFGALLKSISIPHFQRFVRRNALFRSFLQTGVFFNELFWDFVCKEKTAFFRVFRLTPPNSARRKLVGPVCQCPTQCLFVDISFEKRDLWKTCLDSLMIFVMAHSLQSVCPANSQKRAVCVLFSFSKKERK